MCECALQAGAVLIHQHAQVAEGLVPVATRLDESNSSGWCGRETIDIEVTLNEVVSTAFYMTGKISVAGKLAARLDFACSVAQPS